jgi:hypothetical protein
MPTTSADEASEDEDGDRAPVQPPTPFRPPVQNAVAAAAASAVAAAVVAAAATSAPPPVPSPTKRRPSGGTAPPAQPRAPPPPRARAAASRKRVRDDDEFEAASDLDPDSSEEDDDSDDDSSGSGSGSGSGSDSESESESGSTPTSSTVVATTNKHGNGETLPPSRVAAKEAVTCLARLSAVVEAEDCLPELKLATEALERFAETGAGVDSSRVFLGVVQALCATTVDALATAREPMEKVRAQKIKTVEISKSLAGGYRSVLKLDGAVEDLDALRAKLVGAIASEERAAQEAAERVREV